MHLLRSTATTAAAAFVAAPALVAAALGLAAPTPAPTSESFPALAARGYTVTGGAAPGYVEDRACASCHRDLWESFQEVGMARSFYRPSAGRAVEDFSTTFFHAPSGRHYAMALEEGGYVFRRWQLDDEGRRIHAVELPVAWILGSGHTSRTYLFQSEFGELYELPLAWYAQGESWGMAPGFDRPHHQGLGRRVRRECLFCHNAYPDLPAGGDAAEAPHVFPAELPEGIGCQRCHGPGAEHAELAMRGAFGSPELAAKVVNPGKLSPERRDDVCFGCHLQPNVTLSRIRRFGRGDFSFRPGEDLAAYLHLLDVHEEGHDPAERFEINHHPHRLMQSRCWQESGRALSCLTCHDPHRKVPPAERAAHYRQACLGCHQAEACGRPHGASHAADGAAGSTEAADCASCHMPRRRTEDVVQVVMTDHRIERRAAGQELLAPRQEREPGIYDVVSYWTPTGPPDELEALYQTAAVARALPHDEVVSRLEGLLADLQPAEAEPYFDLVRGQLKTGRHAGAEAQSDALLARFPGHPMILGWRALARSGLGRSAEAVADLERVVAASRDWPDADYNLGVILLGRGDPEGAARHLEQAVQARPTFAVAWYYLGRAETARRRPREAVAALERALAVEPSLARAYVELGRLLAEGGERERALRLLRHGARWARPPEPVRELLGELTPGAG